MVLILAVRKTVSKGLLAYYMKGIVYLQILVLSVLKIVKCIMSIPRTSKT